MGAKAALQGIPHAAGAGGGLAAGELQGLVLGLVAEHELKRIARYN